MMQQGKVSIGKFPTPISEEKGLAATDLEGRISLYIKHEGKNSDELGIGIKIRQIGYLFAAAKEQGYTHLIIDGVIDSNCCRAISSYAPRFGLQAVLVIKDEKPRIIPAAHQMMIDSKADIYYIGKNPEPQKLENIKQRIAKEYRDRRANPLIVPTGATCELTIHGGIDIAKEIADYEAERGIRFDYVVVPVGTGGSFFGLEIGRRAIHKGWKVIGIIIDNNNPGYYRQRFFDLGEKFVGLYSLDRNILKEPLRLHEHRGRGYGLFEQGDISEIERINGQQNVNFEPVYSYKCFKGMQELVKHGEIKQNSNILLILTQ